MKDREEIMRMFHGFVRKSLKNEFLMYRRDETQKHPSDISLHEDCVSELSTFGAVEDEYRVLMNKIIIAGDEVTIKEELLYEALMSLEQRSRDVAYLSYALGWSDCKIGSQLRLPRSTVQRLKVTALKELREKLTRNNRKQD